MTREIVSGLIVVLFLAAAGLLGYGAYAFGRHGASEPLAGVNMGREVLWTGVVAALLVAVYLYSRT